MMPPEGNNKALNALFWRDEILQIMYWMQGEQIAESVSAKKLLPLLNISAEELLVQLERLVGQQFLIHEQETYSLNSSFRLALQGRKEAGRKFAEAFQGLQKSGHGECGPDCDCQWEGHETCSGHHHHDH